VTIRFQMTGQHELKAVLTGMRSVLENSEQVHHKIGIQLEKYVDQLFMHEGAYMGRKRWADLKAGGRYKGKGKQRFFQTSYKILQDTGELRASYDALYSKTQAGVGAVKGRPHAELAPIHEYGNPSRNLPARPMLPTAEVMQDVALRIYGIEFRKAGVRI
jgi:phage gpG-like protein